MHEEDSDFWAKTKEKIADKLSTTWDRSVHYVGNKTSDLINALKPNKKTMVAIAFGAAVLGPVATHGWNKLGEVLDYTSAEECQGSADVSACAYTTMYEGGKSVVHHVGRTVGFISKNIDEYRAMSSRHVLESSRP
jgi:hypothetical protein